MRQLLGLLSLIFVFSTVGFGSVGAETDRFQPDLVKVADDIYVFVRSPSYRYPVLSNVVVIINEADVVVVDGGTPRHVENVIRGIKQLTDKPISTVISTHWHQDHYWGHSVYKKYFPEVKLIAQENTAIALINRGGDLKGVLDQLGNPENLAKINAQIDDAIAGFKDAGQDFMVEYFEDYKTGFPEVTEDLLNAQDVPFDATFSDRLVLKRESRTIEILYLGRANTDGDAFIYLPEDKILVTGDTVVWPTPYGFGSYPAEWGETLKKALALDFDIMIPGHGDIQYDTSYAENLIKLMQSITAQTRAAVEGGAENLEEVRERMDFSEFDRLFAGDDPLLLNRFKSWFKTPIMDSAYKEAIGDKIVQYDPFLDAFAPKEEVK